MTSESKYSIGDNVLRNTEVMEEKQKTNGRTDKQGDYYRAPTLMCGGP